MASWRTLLRLAEKLPRLVAVGAYRRGLRHGVAAAVEHRPLLSGLKAPATVIDVGANVGQFSLLARHLFPAAVIHAFEPLPRAAGRLARLFQGDSRFHLHRTALGANAAESPFHVSAREDCSSLKPVGALQQALVPRSATVAVMTVAVRRLDRVLDPAALGRPVLLKVDVQGAEAEVLDGAGGLLPLVDHVLVEVSFVPLYEGQCSAQDVIRRLDAAGFDLAAAGRPWLDDGGRCLQADLLFTARQG